MATKKDDCKMMSDSDLVLITDISGFVASHIADTLHKSGFRVRGTVPTQTMWSKIKWYFQGNENLENIPIEIIEANVHDGASWANAIRDCSYVIHTVCPYANAKQDDMDSVLSLSVQNTMYILRACRLAGTVKRVVLTSSTSAIEYMGVKKAKGYEYTEEDWTNVSAKEATPYGKAMTLTEKAAWSYINTLPDEEKIELVVLNSGFPLGPALVNVPSPNFSLIKNLVEGKISMVPRIFFPVTDVRDLAQAHQQALVVDGAQGKRHIVITKTIALLEVAHILHEAFLVHGYKVPSKQLPDFLVKTLGVFDNSLSSVKGQVGRCSLFSTQRMREVLQITGRPVETSLVEMVHSLIDLGIISKPVKSANQRRTKDPEGGSLVV